jgi:uncharacterized protein with WD repeat
MFASALVVFPFLINFFSRSMNGTLEFYDLNEVALMNVGEHFTATDVEWDPSGRYVSTSVSWWAQKVIHSGLSVHILCTGSDNFSCF